jgi:hypothetical protein
MAVAGDFRAFFLYEVAETIRLETLRPILGAKPTTRAPSFAHPTPEYVRFERPPVVESIEGVLPTPMTGWVKYYDYGVISIELAMPFSTDWESLVSQFSRWTESSELESRARELARNYLDRAAAALVKPYDGWLDEDYYMVHLQDIGIPESTANELLLTRSQEISQLVRGESSPLSAGERQEILQSSISYTPTDLLVVGWTAALIYDTKEGAEATIQLLEYANTELLEFRYYDNLLTRLLEGVYASLEHKGGLFSAWRQSQEAARLGTIRLDVMELTEKVENAIKFLSDMFYARLYQLAARKVGVEDYRKLVDQKLNTAGELYKFMVDQFNQTRSFVLELAVVIILIIDLAFLFRGR